MDIENELDEIKAMLARLTHDFQSQFGTKENDDGFGLIDGQKKKDKKRMDAAESRG